jgi:hypothetical protein
MTEEYINLFNECNNTITELAEGEKKFNEENICFGRDEYDWDNVIFCDTSKGYTCSKCPKGYESVCQKI